MRNCRLFAEQRIPRPKQSREDGWKGFRIQGQLDFSLIGILSQISGVLADAKIGIFAVSTYNTDYILVKAENFARAADVLSAAGFTVQSLRSERQGSENGL